MDGFTIFAWGVSVGGAALLYLRLVSGAIEGVDHTLTLLDRTERSAFRRRNAEKAQANPATADVALSPGSQADAAQALDDSVVRNTIAS